MKNNCFLFQIELKLNDKKNIIKFYNIVFFIKIWIRTNKAGI